LKKFQVTNFQVSSRTPKPKTQKVAEINSKLRIFKFLPKTQNPKIRFKKFPGYKFPGLDPKPKTQNPKSGLGFKGFGFWGILNYKFPGF
jgi:hypothetical protein